MTKNFILKTIIGCIILIITAVFFSPLISLLFSQSSLGRHLYREISFVVIAGNELPKSASIKELMQSAIDYTRTHLWIFGDSRPYPGKPLDYLIEGVGWCDYHAKILCKLLAIKGIHARYAFLLNKEKISPHTVAEVYVKDKWCGVDPLLDIIYYDEEGQMIELEKVTPAMIARIPSVISIKSNNQDLFEQIVNMAKKTYPLPHLPKRSESFLSEKHIFDFIADIYVKIFGRKFTDFYQDIFIRHYMVTIDDPVERLWLEARNYDLYGRLEKAKPIYRQLLRDYPGSTFRRRTIVFLSQLLIKQQRFKEAGIILQQFLTEYPDGNWKNDCHYYIGLCYEELCDIPNAILYYKRARGARLHLEACRRLSSLLP